MERETQGIGGGSGNQLRVIRRLRWRIGGLLFASTVINYIERQTLSVLAPFLKSDYQWTNSDFALLIISFRVAYAVMQSVAGRVLDWLGTRRGLLLSVAWYSVAAIMTATAQGLRSFMVFRFLLGAGEAANWPGATKAVCRMVSQIGARLGGGPVRQWFGYRRSCGPCSRSVALS